MLGYHHVESRVRDILLNLFMRAQVGLDFQVNHRSGFEDRHKCAFARRRRSSYS